MAGLEGATKTAAAQSTLPDNVAYEPKFVEVKPTFKKVAPKPKELEPPSSSSTSKLTLRSLAPLCTSKERLDKIDSSKTLKKSPSAGADELSSKKATNEKSSTVRQIRLTNGHAENLNLKKSPSADVDKIVGGAEGSKVNTGPRHTADRLKVRLMRAISESYKESEGTIDRLRHRMSFRKPVALNETAKTPEEPRPAPFTKNIERNAVKKKPAVKVKVPHTLNAFFSTMISF